MPLTPATRLIGVSGAPSMTDPALDAIRARHAPVTPRDHRNHAYPPVCTRDRADWPCDAADLLAALDRAEAVVLDKAHVVAVLQREAKADRAQLDRAEAVVVAHRDALVTVAQWDSWASEWLAKHPLAALDGAGE